MNLSAKTEYACVAVLELAVHSGSGKPVRIRDIAEANGIPSRFLVQILLQLKGAGLVTSTRGAAGGYHLARDAQEITLGEVMAVIDGHACQLASNLPTETAPVRTLLDVWQTVSNVERKMLNEITFADLVARIRGQTDKMYYI
jgi:Rrf2 family protein